jgi:hypothetical protein
LGVSASWTVESLARQANEATPAAVRHFLLKWEKRSGRRLPRDPNNPRRWGPIPAGVADEFFAQSRKAAK